MSAAFMIAYSILKMKAICSSETPVDFQWTRWHFISGDSNLMLYCKRKIKNKTSSGLQNREYGRRDPSRFPRGTLYPQKVALTSPTSGGRSVGIVRPRIEDTEFSFMRQVNIY
jgi:hypothetical protein